jgi:hypothetical protein
MNRDFLFGGASFVLALVYYVMADAIPTSLLSDAIGPGGLPKAYAVVLGGLSLLLMLRSVVQHRRAAASVGAQRKDLTVQRVQLLRVAGVLGIGAIYVIVVPWLGYVMTLALLIATTTYYQGGALSRQLAIVSVLGALFFWVLFVFLLRIPQPPGIWPDLF